MRLQLRASVALLTLVVAISLASRLETPSSSDYLQPHARSKFPVLRLFDFSNYKKLFNKSYSSVTEELMRQKLFWARAFRALISAVKYRTGQEKYYLSINLMSDKTPRELLVVINDANDGFQSTEQGGTAQFQLDRDGKKVANEPAGIRSTIQGENLEPDLLSYVKSLPGDLTRQELELRVISDDKFADLPIEQLIDSDDEVRLEEETEKKILEEIASSSEAHTISEGSNSLTIGQWERVEFHNVRSYSNSSGPQNKRSRALVGRIKDGWRKAFKRKAARERSQILPDEFFLDLRDTRCFTLPRHQGRCGACYAFVMVSILEWLYCMKTGKLVKFSEQYMIDCGYDNIDTLDGCNGGNPVAAANFVRNFGIELSKRWPHGMGEHQCPYNEDTPLESTGYFRFPLPEGLVVHLDMVPKQLESGPLYVSVAATGDITEYGGGVHGHGCSLTAARHAMTLVGHGRENGQEFWLLRNSYGPGWGEEGYYKLAKEADCISSQRAYVYGSTRDLGDESAYFSLNKSRDKALVKRQFDLIMGRKQATLA